MGKFGNPGVALSSPNLTRRASPSLRASYLGTHAITFLFTTPQLNMSICCSCLLLSMCNLVANIMDRDKSIAKFHRSITFHLNKMFSHAVAHITRARLLKAIIGCRLSKCGSYSEKTSCFDVHQTVQFRIASIDFEES